MYTRFISSQTVRINGHVSVNISVLNTTVYTSNSRSLH